MGEVKVAHRWGAPFVADCGARGRILVAPDEARVNCRDCLSRPVDPALWADRDQFAAAIRDVRTDRCRHGNPEGGCASCAACSACSGDCGTCPYAGQATR